MAMSSELDILLVADNHERFATEIRTSFRHWQVYRADSPHTVWTRKARRAYYTDAFGLHRNSGAMLANLISRGVEVVPFSEYEPPAADVQDFEDARLLREIRRSRHPHV